MAERNFLSSLASGAGDVLAATKIGRAIHDVRRRRELEGRQDEAYNELRNRYGAIAGDPETYGALSGDVREQETYDAQRQRDAAATAVQAARAIAQSAQQDPVAAEEMAAQLAPAWGAIFGEDAGSFVEHVRRGIQDPNYFDALEGLAQDPTQADALNQAFQQNIDPETGLGVLITRGGKEVPLASRPVSNANVTAQIAERQGRVFNPGQINVDGTPAAVTATGGVVQLPEGVERVPTAAQSRASGTAAGQIASLESGIGLLDNSISVLQTVLDEDRINALSSGAIGGMTGGLPGTPAYNLKQTLAPVVNTEFIRQILDLRRSSPTGSAVGNVTEKEGARFETLARSLDVGQDPAQLLRNAEEFLGILTRIRNAQAEDLAALQPQEQYVPIQGGNLSPQQLRELIRQARGQ